jgi:hypothetical protein
MSRFAETRTSLALALKKGRIAAPEPQNAAPRSNTDFPGSMKLLASSAYSQMHNHEKAQRPRAKTPSGPGCLNPGRLR